MGHGVRQVAGEVCPTAQCRLKATETEMSPATACVNPLDGHSLTAYMFVFTF